MGHRRLQARNRAAIVPNTFIGNMGATITDASWYAARTSLSTSDIRGFNIDADNNVSFRVETSYSLNQLVFVNNSTITWFVDGDGYMTFVNQGNFENCSNLRGIYTPGVTDTTTTAGYYFYETIGSVDHGIVMSDLAISRNGFLSVINPTIVYCPSLTTIWLQNSGRQSFLNLDDSEHTYIANVTSFPTQYKRSDQAMVFRAHKDHSKIYADPKVSGNCNAYVEFVVSSASITTGDTISINGLDYFPVTGSPDNTIGEFLLTTNSSTVASSLVSAINNETRSGSTLGTVSALNYTTWVRVQQSLSGTTGNSTPFSSTTTSGFQVQSVSDTTFTYGGEPEWFLSNVRDRDFVDLIFPNDDPSGTTINPPSGLTVSAESATEISVHFTPPEDNVNYLQGYEIWVRNDAEPWTKYTPLFSTYDNSNVIVDGLTTGTTYYVKVRAFDGFYNLSEFTEEVPITIYIPNTFIGGVGATYITSPADYVSITSGLVEGDIIDFQIDGNNDVSFYVGVDYTTVTNSFLNVTEMTHFIDADGYLTGVANNNAFKGCTGLKYFYAPGIVTKLGLAGAFGAFLQDATSLEHINLENAVASGGSDTGRNTLDSATSLKKLYLPNLVNLSTVNSSGYLAFQNLSSLERLYIANVTDMEIYYSNLARWFQDLNSGCTVYYGSALGATGNRNAWNSITATGGYADGDILEINGLSYTAVTSSPTEGQFLMTGNQNADAVALRDAINADTRTGTTGSVIADLTVNSTLGMYVNLTGSTGDTVTIETSGVTASHSVYSYPTFTGGSDIHFTLMYLRDVRGCTLVEVSAPITVNPPTDFYVGDIDEINQTVKLHFTEPTPNANGTECFELWIDDGGPMGYFEHSEISGSGVTVSLSGNNTFYGTEFKIRTMDGHMNFSSFATYKMVDTTPNLYIGGIGTGYTNPVELATRFNISEENILNYNIDANNNVSCYITAPFATVSSAFNSNTDLTYWVLTDPDLQTNYGQSTFFACTNMTTFVGAEEVTATLGGYFMRQNYVKDLNFPKTTLYSTSVSITQQYTNRLRLPKFKMRQNLGIFYNLERLYIPSIELTDPTTANTGKVTGLNNNVTIYVNDMHLTTNFGSLDATLQWLVDNRSATIVGIENNYRPFYVQDLSASGFTEDGCVLTFTEPYSQNAVDFYEVYVENLDLDEWHKDRVEGRYNVNQEISGSGAVITGLTSGTTYGIRVVTCDEYWNRSGFSNEVQVTILPPNTFIGGVGSSLITSAADYVSITSGLVEADIIDFQIDGNNNVSFYIGVNSYGVNNNFLSNNSDVTYFIDLGGKIPNIGLGVANSPNLEYFYIPTTVSTTNSEIFRELNGLRHLHIENMADDSNRYILRNATSLEKLYMPSLSAITKSSYNYDKYIGMTALKRAYLPNVDTVNTIFTYGSYIENSKTPFYNIGVGCKIYHNSVFSATDRNAFNSFTGGTNIDLGDVYYINGLAYTCVTSASADGEFTLTTQFATVQNLTNAINSDTRTGATYSSVSAYNFYPEMAVWVDSVGTGGEVVSATTDVGNTGSGGFAYTTFKGGNDVHPFLMYARDFRSATLVEVTGTTAVSAPTSLDYSGLTTSGCTLIFTEPTPNANGNDGYEVWVDDGTIYRPLFEYGEVSGTNQVLDLSEVYNDVGTILGTKIKIRTIDGHMNYSDFSNEITLTDLTLIGTYEDEATLTGVPVGIWVDSGSTMVFVVDYGGDDLERFDMSTTNDITTISTAQADNYIQEGQPYGLWIAEDGHEFLITDYSPTTLKKQYMTTAYDTTSITGASQTYDISSYVSAVGSIKVLSGGTKILVAGTQGVLELSLSGSSLDLTTVSAETLYAVGTYGISRNIDFIDNGNKLLNIEYGAGPASWTLNIYELSTPYDFSSINTTPIYTRTVETTDELYNGYQFVRGEYLWFVQRTSPKTIYQYRLDLL